MGGISDAARDAADTADADEPVLTLDAAAVAPLLGLTPERFMAELQRGVIVQRTERGTGEDSGLWRVTFRFHAQNCRVVVEPRTGFVVPG